MASSDILVLHPKKQFDAIGRNVVLEHLHEVGYFSINPGDSSAECSITFDRSGLAVIKPQFQKSIPGLNFDLNTISSKTSFVSPRMDLSHCFSLWLEHFQAEPAYGQLKSKIDFVFHGDDLSGLMRAPYAYRGSAGWTVEVERLDQLMHCKLVRDQPDITDHGNWKFYSLLCDEPKDGKTFISVRFARISGYGVLFPKYIGAALTSEAGTEYVNVMNVSAAQLSPVLLTTWSTAVVAGIRHVVFGIKEATDNNVIAETRIVEVKQLRDWVVSENRARKDYRQVWKEESCLGFLKSFLDFIRTNVMADSTRMKYAFKFSGNPEGKVPFVECERITVTH